MQLENDMAAMYQNSGKKKEPQKAQSHFVALENGRSQEVKLAHLTDTMFN